MRAFRYSLPLCKPLQLAGTTIEAREGVLLHHEDKWGDAAPLIGFSRECLTDVVQELKEGSDHPSPSLRFALDSLQVEHTSRRVPINALLLASEPHVLRTAFELSGSSCEAVKLKVGRGGHKLERDADVVRQVREILRPEQRLRLDANRAWDLRQAGTFLEHLAGCEIEYIEEPLHNPLELETLFTRWLVPYALDETLAEPWDPGNFPNAAALVVKPTLIGGRAQLEQLAKLEKPMVLSAAFESGVGIARLAELGAEFSPGIPIGLDTYAWLADDVLGDRLVTDDWHMLVPSRLAVCTLRLEELTL